MKIELNRKSEDFSHRCDLEESAEVLDLRAEGAAFEDPVKVQLSVTKSQDQIICRGKVTTAVKLECSRCLSSYRYGLSSGLDFVVDLTGDSAGMKSDEEGYFVADPSSDYFEIDSLVRESIILSLPFKPLCSESCRGLCPTCGTDLNRSKCDCVRESVDPRWDQLKRLLNKKS